jgi:hypothetical protein
VFKCLSSGAQHTVYCATQAPTHINTQHYIQQLPWFAILTVPIQATFSNPFEGKFGPVIVAKGQWAIANEWL